MAISPAQVEKFLHGVDYPATKDELIQAARNNGAGQEVIGTLQKMGETMFEKPTDIAQAIGNIE